MKKSIVIATRNRHKFNEIAACLHNNQYEPLFLDDLPHLEEFGLSFMGNALIKAKMISQHTGKTVLADDSGLCVEALNDGPGVFSARFAGLKATDADNNRKLIQELKKLGKGPFDASYVCSMVLYQPSGEFFTSVGRLAGMIVEQPTGHQGFGYDPHFFLPTKRSTLAEISMEEKIQFSHRTKALENLLEIVGP